MKMSANNTDGLTSQLNFEDFELLNISAVAEWAYCPRSSWYEIHNGRRKARNVHVESGLVEDEKRLERAHRNVDNRKIHFGLPLRCDELGLRGQADAIWEDPGLLTVVEYRHGAGPGNKTDKLTLIFLMMAVAETTGHKNIKGRLFFTGNRNEEELEFTDENMNEARNCASAVRSMLCSSTAPKNEYKPICNGCSWFGICCPDLTSAHSSDNVRVLPRCRFDRVLYVDNPGAKIRLKGQALEVTKAGETLASVGLETVDQVVLVGKGTHLTTPALRTLSTHGIEVVLLSAWGRFQGRVVTERYRNPSLQRAHHRRTLDPVFRLTTARSIVSAKLHNQRIQLQRLKRRANDPEKLVEALSEIQKLIGRVNQCESIEKLRGLEGLAAHKYFRAVAVICVERGFSFDRRSRRPPRDPFNALLSFCYSLLTKDVEAAIQLVGLNPVLGVYHGEVYGRPALALDLMEEFRPVLADAVALRLINQRILQQKHFESELGTVKLCEAGRKKLYQAWERRLNESLVHPWLDTSFSYRRTLELQARLFAKVLEGDVTEYRPLRLR
jgi:CRISP-associated protein Cas1